MTQVTNVNPRTKTNNKNPGKFTEIGTIGLNAYANSIHEAYIAELRWPAVQPIYSKMWRANPEVTIARNIMTALASSVDLKPVLPDNPTDDDKRAADFITTEFENIDGGIAKWRDKLVSVLPFFGWGWWEIVPSFRRPSWKPPGENDDWRSAFDDGLIGARRLAWRDYSSFSQWKLDEKGRVLAMEQIDKRGNTNILPANRAVHIRFGDLENPEGLATLETHYRLERIKYGLEFIYGVGAEHAAGHLSVTVEGNTTLSDEDIAMIKRAARAILTAQEGNYATWPEGMSAELLSSNFTAGATVLEGIRYYGLLTLQLYNMQWVAMSTVSGVGSFSAMQDSSQMSITTFNAMMETFVDQFNEQYIAWLFKVNKDSFPNLSAKPKVVATKVRKNIDLDQLTSFLEFYADRFEVSEGDLLNIRTQTEILKEELPTEDMVVPVNKEAEPSDDSDNDLDDGEDDPDESDMSIVRGDVVEAIQKSPNFIQRMLNIKVK